MRGDALPDGALAKSFDVRWTPVAFLALHEPDRGFVVLRILTGWRAPRELEEEVRGALAAHERLAALAHSDPKDVPAQAELAELSWEEQRFQAATTAWLAVVENDPEDRTGKVKAALLGLCRAYVAAGAERDEVFAQCLGEYLTRLLALDPANEPRYRAALALQQAYRMFGGRRYADAARALDAVARSYPKADAAAEALYWLGVTEALQGNRPQFEAAWDRLVGGYPESVWARRARWKTAR